MDEIIKRLDLILAELKRLNPAPDIERCVDDKRFPWEQITRKKMFMFGLEHQHIRGRLTQYKWPLTCRDLIDIGRDEICSWSDIGPTSIRQINEILSELGMQELK